MTAAGLASVVVANNQGNYFPPTPEGLKVVESKHHEGVKISYKEVSFPFLLRIGKRLQWIDKILARHLRNYSRRQKLCRLRAPASRCARRCR